MKATFFNKPLEWNVEATGEAWTQGSSILGNLKIKNHGTESLPLPKAGVALAYADIKKVHAKTPGALKFEDNKTLDAQEIRPGETLELSFSLLLPPNCCVSDKKATYFLAYGREFLENHLQLKIDPRPLYTKIVGLMDTFYRFKVKEIKAAKTGVEFKLIPPTSRDMANLEMLGLNLSMDQDNLILDWEFQVKRLDTSSVTTKINKEVVKMKTSLLPKQYSLGKDMINQDTLLKSIESVLAEVKIKSVF